jgi:hypothetical protein
MQLLACEHDRSGVFMVRPSVRIRDDSSRDEPNPLRLTVPKQIRGSMYAKVGILTPQIRVKPIQHFTCVIQPLLLPRVPVSTYVQRCFSPRRPDRVCSTTLRYCSTSSAMRITKIQEVADPDTTDAPASITWLRWICDVTHRCLTVWGVLRPGKFRRTPGAGRRALRGVALVQTP